MAAEERGGGHTRRRRLRWRLGRHLALLSLLVAALALSACGNSGTTSTKAPVSTAGSTVAASTSPSTTAPTDSSASADAMPAGIDLVPQQDRANYVGYRYLSSGMELGKSPYANWTPPKPPWKICYSAITQQNSWHVDAMKMFVTLGNQLKAQGDVSDVVTTNSDGNTGVQINQINGMVSQGCDAIAAITPSATALCPAFKNAFDHHVLIFSAEGSVDCPGIGQAVQPNDYIDGVKSMEWLAGAMGGKGNLLMLQGMPSYPLSQARVAGAKSVLARYPNIKLQATLVTEWNAATAKTRLLQYLATHPAKVDGVWQEGCCGDITSVQALKQTGRPPAIVNGWGGSAAWMAFWKENKLNSFDLLQGGPSQAVNYFEVMIRMLSGQKPKVNNLIHTVTFLGNDDVSKYYQSWMTDRSTSFVMPPGSRSVPSSYWNAFFVGGDGPLPKFDPTKFNPQNG
jgi:ribose transport system substrate-binding protein